MYCCHGFCEAVKLDREIRQTREYINKITRMIHLDGGAWFAEIPLDKDALITLRGHYKAKLNRLLKQ